MPGTQRAGAETNVMQRAATNTGPPAFPPSPLFRAEVQAAAGIRVKSAPASENFNITTGLDIFLLMFWILNFCILLCYTQNRMWDVRTNTASCFPVSVRSTGTPAGCRRPCATGRFAEGAGHGSSTGAGTAQGPRGAPLLTIAPREGDIRVVDGLHLGVQSPQRAAAARDGASPLAHPTRTGNSPDHPPNPAEIHHPPNAKPKHRIISTALPSSPLVASPALQCS